MTKEVKRYVSTRILPDSATWNISATPHTYVHASDYAALEQEHKGLLAQHARDSAELRSLCQARDDARRERDAALLQVEALRSNFPRIDPSQPVPLDETKHCCEHTLYLERERLHRLIDAALQAKP